MEPFVMIGTFCAFKNTREEERNVFEWSSLLPFSLLLNADSMRPTPAFAQIKFNVKNDPRVCRTNGE